jgi:hypothetical protein
MQRFKKIGLALVLGTLGTVGLRADDAFEYSAKFGWVNSMGDMHTLTKNSMGTGAELGLDWKPSKEMGVGIGSYVNFVQSKGKSNGSRTYTAKGTSLGLDLIYQVGELPLWIRTGPQVTSWDITNLKPFNAGDNGAQGDTSRFKPGWRLGAEYRISKQWSATVMYTASTFGQIADPSNEGLTPEETADPQGKGVLMKQVHPSYLTVMVGFKF